MAAAHAGLPTGEVRFDDWLAALGALVDRGGLIVLDEFPYLLQHNPELPSVLQRLYDERRTGPPTRLLLCGSAVSVMSSLLVGQHPLRGRAQLDLRVEAFDYRTARGFWRIEHPEVALAVDATIGGAPGYRDLVATEPPASMDGFGAWLGATVLNPSHALYREDEFLLREDPRIADRALYQSILAVIAAGEHTPTRIGARLGRDRTAQSQLLGVLQEAGFVRKEVDASTVAPSPTRSRTPCSASPASSLLRPGAAGPAPLAGGVAGQRAHVARTDPRSTRRTGRPSVGADLRELRDDRWTGGACRRDDRRRPCQPIQPAGRSRGPRCAWRGAGPRRGRGHARSPSGRRPPSPRTRPCASERRRRELLVVSVGGFAPDLLAEAASRPDVELVDLERLYAGS